LALKGNDPPVVVIGELKLTFNLELVLHGVDRAAACDEVFVKGSALACSECQRTAKSSFCCYENTAPRAVASCGLGRALKRDVVAEALKAGASCLRRCGFH
jgi:hypothetical protein